MRSNKTELIFIFLLTVVTDVVVLLEAPVPARVVFGIPYLLFLPGYALIAALFPRKDDLDSIERIALSFGLSIAVVPLTGLILNYTPWGIRLEPIVSILTLFVIIMLAITWRRRQKLSDAEMFYIKVRMPSFGWGKMAWIDRVLAIILVMAIIGAIGSLVYVVVTPKEGEKFTEFYMLDSQGQAQNYPNDLDVGQEGKVIIGVVNHEQEATEYRLEARLDGISLPMRVNGQESGEYAITLAQGEKWEQEIGFAIQQASLQQRKVEFMLWNTNLTPEAERSAFSRAGNTSFDLELKQIGSITVKNEGAINDMYTVKIMEGGALITPPQSFELAAGGGEETISFNVTSVQDVEVLVYGGNTLMFTNSGASLSLHLWVTVE